MTTLTYESVQLNLPNPDLGNQTKLDFHRVSRASLGGDTIIFRDTEWPKTETFTLNFELLTCLNAQIDKIKNFIRDTLGRICVYVDHEGVTWNVLILNPETAIKQSKIHSYTLSLELEAEKVI